MEKQTRVTKYKELRDEMKEEVAIHHQLNETIIDEDDDFLSFIPKTEEKKNIDDTLMEPLSYETLNDDNDNVKHALNKAKENVGKEQYNTRLDILNRIKQEESTIEKEVPQKEQTQHVEPQRKMSLLEKLAAMSPEEDAEELKKYEEQLKISDYMKEEKKQKKKEKAKKVEKDVQEQPKEKESKLITFLNYVIVLFMIIFVVLVIFIVKQLFF